MKTVETDRYISFFGIACDENADKLVSMLETHLHANHGAVQWQQYFNHKRIEQKRMQHDNLNLVGSQVNALYEYFNECKDQQALDLLYKIEQECC
ncbi:MAG: N(2)-fixation sustaining protein CowN [Colwellia sp.]